MRAALLTLCVLLCATAATAQMTSSHVEVVTVHSQNGRFYLKSFPYDDEEPSLRGKTLVYERGVAAPLYVVARGFDLVVGEQNNLLLSDDGEVIFYAVPWGADESREGLKGVTFYRRGEIIKSFTETEVNGCDKKAERCSLLYSNYNEVVDKERSNFGSRLYKKVFKEGVSEKEKFLSDFPVFSSGGEVYLTDSKRRVHVFDFKTGERLRSEPFDEVFERIRDKARPVEMEVQSFESPPSADFPKLRGGRDTHAGLAEHIDMKAADLTGEQDKDYKIYRFNLSGLLARDGSFEVEQAEFYDELPREKILEFFKVNRFDTSWLPQVFDKWHVDEYFYFRKKDARLARRERQEELAAHGRELAKNLTAESIGGVHIPKDLGECLAELDKLLTEIDKKEMRELPTRDGMLRYHLTLGMWMRNNWRLWGGSRLQKYFADRGVTHPEEMSSVVLYHYHDWLRGRRETWKEWERAHAVR
ncbi:MAG TPA: DUF6794 domain-containing protein [Pyrinomonadaceae bacterium]|nr:DUF6794 domain-containing protein [Pyrinomonadaceae bacterium]